jgi:hypothetical protein
MSKWGNCGENHSGQQRFSKPTAEAFHVSGVALRDKNLLIKSIN